MLPGSLATGFYRVVIQLWVGFCVDMPACRTPKQALTLKVGTSWVPPPPMDSGCLCVGVLFVLFLPPCWLWGLAERQGLKVGKRGQKRLQDGWVGRCCLRRHGRCSSSMCPPSAQASLMLSRQRAVPYGGVDSSSPRQQNHNWSKAEHVTPRARHYQ